MSHHVWIDHGPVVLLGSKRRRCSECGAIQEWDPIYAWGRIVKRQWRPLVGRCLRRLRDSADMVAMFVDRRAKEERHG